MSDQQNSWTPRGKVKKGYDLRGAPYDLTGFFVFSEDSLSYVPIVQTFLLSAHVDTVVIAVTSYRLHHEREWWDQMKTNNMFIAS